MLPGVTRRIRHYAATLNDLRELLSRDDKALREAFALERARAVSEGTNRPIDRVSFVAYVVRTHFAAASAECGVERYESFANFIDDSALGARLRCMCSTEGLFLSRRQCGEFIGCGSLNGDEVREMHVALGHYVDHPQDWVRDFASELRRTCEVLLAKGSGSIFVVTGDESF